MSIYFKSNTRAQQLEKHERICREQGWLKKGEVYLAEYTKPYVIFENGFLIGYFCINEFVREKQTCVWGFYILPEHRNKGKGTQALLSILRTLYNTKKPQVFVRVNVENKIAQHIYFKYGYVYGKDERLYADLESCKYPLIDNNEYIVIFMQKVWGEQGYTIKESLESVFSKN